MKKLLISLALLACIAPAQAQNLDYYLTPQSQLDSMNASNYYATQAANAWLQYCQQLRAQGYQGRIDCPLASTQSLVNSNRELQNAYSNYNAGWWQNQSGQAAAAQGWSASMRDQAQMVDPYTGQGYTVQPGQGNAQWVNPYTGVVVPTSGYYPPNYQDPWNQLR